MNLSFISDNDRFKLSLILPAWESISSYVTKSSVTVDLAAFYQGMLVETVDKERHATLMFIGKAVSGSFIFNKPWVAIITHTKLVPSCTNTWECTGVWACFKDSLPCCVNEIYDLESSCAELIFIAPGGRYALESNAKKEIVSIFESKALISDDAAKLIIAKKVAQELDTC